MNAFDDPVTDAGAHSTFEGGDDEPAVWVVPEVSTDKRFDGIEAERG